MFSSPLSLFWVRYRVCSADNDACGGNEKKRKGILELPREKLLMIFVQPLWVVAFCFLKAPKSLTPGVPLSTTWSRPTGIPPVSPFSSRSFLSRRRRRHFSSSGFNWLFPEARLHVTSPNTCTATSSQRPHPLRQVQTRLGSSSPRRSRSGCEPRSGRQGRG